MVSFDVWLERSRRFADGKFWKVWLDRGKLFEDSKFWKELLPAVGYCE